MSQFEYNINVGFYLKQGWKLVSPSKYVCAVCSSALIQNEMYDFMFCVPCQAKTKLEGNLSAHEKQQYAANPKYESDQAQQVREPQEDITSQLLLQGWKMTAKTCPIAQCYSPLMQKPSSNQLVCGKCGFESTTNNSEIKQVSFDANAGDLARQIANRVQKRVNHEEVTEEDYQCIQQKTNQVNHVQEVQTNINQIYTEQDRGQILKEDLKQKIYEYIDLILQPNNEEEIEKLMKILHNYHICYKILQEVE